MGKDTSMSKPFKARYTDKLADSTSGNQDGPESALMTLSSHRNLHKRTSRLTKTQWECLLAYEEDEGPPSEVGHL